METKRNRRFCFGNATECTYVNNNKICVLWRWCGKPSSTNNRRKTYTQKQTSRLTEQIFHSFIHIQYTSFATIYFFVCDSGCSVCEAAFLCVGQFVNNSTKWMKKTTSYTSSVMMTGRKKVYINLCMIYQILVWERASAVSTIWKEPWLNIAHTLEKWIVRVFWHESNLLASFNLNEDSSWIQFSWQWFRPDSNITVLKRSEKKNESVSLVQGFFVWILGTGHEIRYQNSNWGCS